MSHPNLTPGLVSVTFRQLSPQQIVALSREAGLRAIEWGGDVHCPPGDRARAEQVRAMTGDGGLTCYAYGSYYRLGGGHPQAPTFEPVLATAVALGAPSIRVWAGTQGSAKSDAAQRSLLVDDLRRIADMAGAHSVNIALEYHTGTETDTPESTVALLRAADRANVVTYWQPRHGFDVQTHLADLELLRPWLANVHAFHWWPTAETRWPLVEGEDRWRTYLDAIASDGRAHVVALEFVRGDDPEQLRADAQTLLALL